VPSFLRASTSDHVPAVEKSKKQDAEFTVCHFRNSSEQIYYNRSSDSTHSIRRVRRRQTGCLKNGILEDLKEHSEALCEVAMPQAATEQEMVLSRSNLTEESMTV
jgi:hypothetical protein